MSGPAIRPIAVRCVYQVARELPHVPIIGIGGVVTARDALEFLLAGAWAVQVGTANFVNPRTALEIVDGLAAYLLEHGIGDVNELVGVANPGRTARLVVPVS